MKHLFLSALIFTLGQCYGQNQGAEMLHQMVDRIQGLSSFSGDMLGNERVDGEIRVSRSRMIVQFKPRFLYVQAITDDGEIGNEILYREGFNDNKVLISPDGFPYVNISLDPQSSFMRNNRHNTILEAGGSYLAEVIQNMLTTSDSATLMNSVKYKGIQEYKGKACHKIVIQNPNYAIIEYKATEGESVRSIAFKENVAEYKIVELNDDIDDFNDSPENRTIKIPNSYAKRTELYLDEELLLPWYVVNFDEIGLFSSYEYKALEANPVINKETFNPDNPEYGF